MASRSLFIRALALSALFLATLLSTAHAGAVFDIKKPILPNGTDYLVTFNLTAPLPAGTPGSIVRSSTPFNATSLPFAIFTLNKCSVLSFHFHPLGNEQLFIIEGSVEVGMFFEDGVLRQVAVPAGQAVIIPQGTVHYVRNTFSDVSQFLQVFDHPLAGAQFVGPALLAMPADVLASAFNGTFPSGVTGTIFTLKQCAY